MKRIKTFILIGIVLIAIISTGGWIRSCKNNTELSQILRDTTQHFVQLQLQSGKMINMQEQKIITYRTAATAYRETIKDLRERDLERNATIIRLKQEIKRLKIEIPFADTPDTVTKYDTVYPEGMIAVPKDFLFTDKWFNIEGVVHQNGVDLMELSILTEPTIYVGYHDPGFLKASTPVITWEDENPFVQTNQASNIVIQSKPFFERAWVKWTIRGLFFAGGYTLGK